MNTRVQEEEDPLRIPTNARARLRAARRKEGEQLYYSTYARRLVGGTTGLVSIDAQGKTTAGPLSSRMLGASGLPANVPNVAVTGERALRNVPAYTVVRYGEDGAPGQVITPLGDVNVGSDVNKQRVGLIDDRLLNVVTSSTMGGRRVNHAGQLMDANRTAMDRIMRGDFYAVKGSAVPEASDVVPLIPDTLASRTLTNDGRDIDSSPLVVLPFGHGTAEVDALSKRKTHKHMRFARDRLTAAPVTCSQGTVDYHSSHRDPVGGTHSCARINDQEWLERDAGLDHTESGRGDFVDPFPAAGFDRNEGDYHLYQGHTTPLQEVPTQYPSSEQIERARPDRGNQPMSDPYAPERSYGRSSWMGSALPGYMRNTESALKKKNSESYRTNLSNTRGHSNTKRWAHSTGARISSANDCVPHPLGGTFAYSNHYLDTLPAQDSVFPLSAKQEALEAAKKAQTSACILSQSELDEIRRVANTRGVKQPQQSHPKGNSVANRQILF